MKRKLLAAILILTLLAGWIPAAAEEEASLSETIRIGSVEDFLSFAQDCTLDSWSVNKQVLLLTDISLEGTDFSPIPTFGGGFDGGGHTISGLTIRQSVSPAGLFGCLQATAVVKNLTVQGYVAPDGDGMTAGGVVGENYGSVEHCAFSGTVEGKTNTGGIAGRSSGTLRNCNVQGTITGDNRTGGIAGYNDGQIDGCSSSAAVNTESVDPTIDLKDIHLNFNFDFSQTSNLDTADAATDTGGIVGYSSGSVVNCVNTGNVGYPHIGYNLGGIAGRSCGLVDSCRNLGTITGRKDVGGVVGQVEPHIQTVLSPDYLETLSRQFENLGSLVNSAGSDGAATGGAVQSCIQSISGYHSSAKSALESLAAAAGSGRVDVDALEALSSSVHGMVNASGSLRNTIGQGVDTLTSDVSAITGQINAIAHTFALATEDAKKDLVTDISQVDLDDISQGRVVSCANQSRVEGDLNVGGITGIMGLESTADPEDDAPGGNLTQRRRYELKAIVQNCENTGVVTGKRSYVGAVCGRMELGLICDSRGYGAVTSENGDYVGGIAGMTGGTIRNCFAKCTLSGGSYVGGIVGCGIAEDYSGDSSTVADCYSMVEVLEAKQYVGAVSGANIGDFTGNYFVSDTLAGINRVSYFSKAEPLTYDGLRKAETLPAELRKFTLSFVADGETIKTLSFDYGDSFDASVFPEIPQKEGCYARWSTTDLTDLRFDTVVEASYYPYITSLCASQTRQEGKPILFVQGQFKDGDVLQVEPDSTEFHSTEETLLEQWRVAIPADGLETHSFRYLPGQGHTAIYLLKNGSWSKAKTEQMGSYLVFEASGSEVVFAVAAFEPQDLRWVIPAGAAAVLVLILLLIFWRKWKKNHPKSPKAGKKKRWLLILLVILLLAGAAAATGYLLLPKEALPQSAQAVSLVQNCLEQPELEMCLNVKAQFENTETTFTAQISRTTEGEKPVSAITENGRKLYYADGTVFLPNGTAYRLNQAAPDYSDLLELVGIVYGQAQTEASEGVYTMAVEGETAASILKLLMPSVQALVPEANSLTADVIAENGGLKQIRFTGAGNLTDSVKTPFSVSATLDILPVSEDIVIPGSVAQAIRSGHYQATEIYSDDLVRLVNAWTQLRSKNPITAELVLEGNCGQLSVSDTFTYYRWRESGREISAVEKDGKTVYFTDQAVCNEQGRTASTAQIGTVDATGLLKGIYDNFSNAEFTCRQENGVSIYTVTLNQQGMAQLVETVLPKAGEMNIAYEKGSIRLAVRDGLIQSVGVTCGGSGKLLSGTLDASLSAQVLFRNDSPGPDLPEAVKAALLK